MKVSVTFEDQLYSLDISEDLELENLKALLEYESGKPATELSLYYNGVHLGNLKKSLKYYGIKEGEMIVMIRKMADRPPQQPRFQGVTASTIDWSNVRVPATSTTSQTLAQQNSGQLLLGSIDPLVLREMLLADSYQRSMIKERNPPLSEALESGDPQQFVDVFEQQKKARDQQEQLRRRMLQADPLDIEAQQKIAEEIQQANINANMETAMEFSPESFGQVMMLYINCRVNDQPVKAFVDSGAQMTIMSVACAERCNIMRLVDRRFAGVAKGIGTQKIIGRVHVAQIQIEQDFLQSSFCVLEQQPMDMLLGLDMLKRHQCTIDLKTNVLRIGTTGTETIFLPEAELPDCARLSGIGSDASQEKEDKDLAEAINRSTQDAPSSSTSSWRSSFSGPTRGSSGSSSQTITSPLPSNVSEADIQRLINMGFNRDDVVRELEKNGGDIDKTTTVLLARSLTFKP